MVPYEILVKKVENGYIISWKEDLNDGVVKEFHEVYQEIDELRTLQELLYAVLEHFGYYGSKHDKERLFVEIKQQHEGEQCVN